MFRAFLPPAQRESRAECTVGRPHTVAAQIEQFELRTAAHTRAHNHVDREPALRQRQHTQRVGQREKAGERRRAVFVERIVRQVEKNKCRRAQGVLP